MHFVIQKSYKCLTLENKNNKTVFQHFCYVMTTKLYKKNLTANNIFQYNEFLLFKDSQCIRFFSGNQRFSINEKLYKKYKNMCTCLTYFYAIINNNSYFDDLLLLITAFLFFNKIKNNV